MLGRFEDELLHSYIVRRLMSVGEFEAHAFSRIIRKSGCIKANPEILTRHIHYFQTELPTLQYTTLRDFASPFSNKNIEINGEFARINRSLFHRFPEGNYFSGTTQMRFCPDCMKDKIYSDGVAWFEDEWAFSQYCPKHSKLMQKVSDYGCSCGSYLGARMTVRLLSVFTGICKICGEDVFGSQASRVAPEDNPWFHDIIYKDGDEWYGVDGKKYDGYQPQIQSKQSIT